MTDFSSPPGGVLLDQDFLVADDVIGILTFPSGTALPAVADLHTESRVLFLGADFEHVVVQVPKIIRHRLSIYALDMSHFLVTKEGVLQLEDTAVFPKEVRMLSGQTYMLLNNEKVVAIKRVDMSKLEVSADVPSQTMDLPATPDESIIMETLQSDAQVLQETTSSVNDLGPPLRASSSNTDSDCVQNDTEPENISIQASSAAQSQSTEAMSVSKSVSHISSKGICQSSVSPWLKNLEENYEEVFLPTLTPQIRLALCKNEKFRVRKWNMAVLDELLALSYTLSGNHRPNLRECNQLASILGQKHPRNYGTVDVATMGSGKKEDLGGDKGTGGMHGNKFLGKRIHDRYYDLFLRQRQAITRSQEVVTEGEPPKKKAGGRPKRIDGVDSNKMHPKLTSEEKIEKTTLLENAEDQNFEERSAAYKFNVAGSVVQLEMISSSVSSAKALAPSFFQSSIHLENLFFSISLSNNIFEKTRNHLQEEIQVLEEFLLDELLPGKKTSLIQSMLEKKDNPSKHAFNTLRLLAEVWEQNIDRLIFIAEKDDQCLKDCPEPHLVASLGDLNNLALYVDQTRILDCLDVPSGLAALIAVHFLANLQYGKECLLLKEYLQREVMELGQTFDVPKHRKKELRQLISFKNKKRDIVRRIYEATVTARKLI